MAKDARTVPENADKEKDERMLSGLCYIPIFLLNVIVPVYVLIVKKDMKNARYHALQALSIAILFFIVQMLGSFWMISQIGGYMLGLQNASIAVNAQNATASAQTQQFFTLWSSMMITMLPLLVFSLIYFLINIVFAVCAFVGKGIRVPVLAGMIDKTV